MAKIKEIRADLMVIGSGMAGMAAALFAARRKIDTVQVGVAGEINFASGLLDVLGIHPQAKGVRRADPWAGIQQLVRDEPRHPYGLLAIDQIREAMDTCLDFLTRAGLPYRTNGALNSKIVTPAGTVKITYGVPASMFAGVEALAARKPALLVDFAGLKGFSGRQIIATVGPLWPGLKGVRIAWPQARGELYTEHIARHLEVQASSRRLAESIQPHVGKAQAVGLPALLGIYRTREIIAEMERVLGVAVFEIPTMVPAVTGLRLRETFEQQLPKLGVRAFYQQKVLETQVQPNGEFLFLVGGQAPELRVRARSALLASGRFFGKGLRADRIRIHETLFDLPVDQPANRSLWHHKDLFNPQGHLINRAGLVVDPSFRPMDAGGKVIHDRLHAAGSILAHQDWMRQKCGSGLSIATAFGAVNALAQGHG
jgi:glycerol-3-phosphate dehydrogenase subunit B